MSNCPAPLPASKNNPWPKVMGANRITPFPSFPTPLSGCLHKANGEDHKSRLNCLSLTASPLKILTPKHELQSQPPPVLHHLVHFGALMWKTRWKENGVNPRSGAGSAQGKPGRRQRQRRSQSCIKACAGTSQKGVVFLSEI